MKITTAIFFLLLIASCSKKQAGDKQAPVVTITSPANNQSFIAGETISITGNATDNDKVTELHIHVKNKTTGALLRDIHAYPGQASGITTYSFAAEAGLQYLIQLIAKDPSQNTGTATVEVSVN